MRPHQPHRINVRSDWRPVRLWMRQNTVSDFTEAERGAIQLRVVCHRTQADDPSRTLIRVAHATGDIAAALWRRIQVAHQLIQMREAFGSYGPQPSLGAAKCGLCEHGFGGDKGFDSADFVNELRSMNVTVGVVV